MEICGAQHPYVGARTGLSSHMFVNTHCTSCENSAMSNVCFISRMDLFLMCRQIPDSCRSRRVHCITICEIRVAVYGGLSISSAIEIDSLWRCMLSKSSSQLSSNYTCLHNSLSRGQEASLWSPYSLRSGHTSVVRFQLTTKKQVDGSFGLWAEKDQVLLKENSRMMTTISVALSTMTVKKYWQCNLTAFFHFTSPSEYLGNGIYECIHSYIQLSIHIYVYLRKNGTSSGSIGVSSFVLLTSSLIIREENLVIASMVLYKGHRC